MRKTLSAAVAVLLLSLAWLPAWGQDSQDHHQKVDAAHPIEPPTFAEPSICKTVDNLPKDHIWKGDESWIRAACRSARTGSQQSVRRGYSGPSWSAN